MVGLLGGGLTHLRTSDGQHRIIDGLGCAPMAAHPSIFEPIGSGAIEERRLTRDRANELGARAVAVPGALAAWCELLSRHGRWSLADVIEPAIRIASRGFTITPYLATNIAEQAALLARDPGLAALLLPGGQPLAAGARLLQPDLADTLRTLAAEGPDALYRGALGTALANTLARTGGLITHHDLEQYTVRSRAPIRARYRDHEIVGPPPPASSGVHIAQMLNVLEHFDIRQSGFGTAATCHLLAEAMAIAFADRSAATGDPEFVQVPVDTLISKTYARARAALIDPTRRRSWQTGLARVGESADTTHLTIADADGMVVASTQTLNGPFGAGLMIPGTGLLANNYLYNFDPHPGNALSIAPGKRVFTSMAPMMLLYRRGENAQGR